MQDSGIPLHQAFKENFRTDTFIQMMADYTALQINTTDKIEIFLKLRVPDWRLEKLPKLYGELIAEEDLLIEVSGARTPKTVESELVRFIHIHKLESLSSGRLS